MLALLVPVALATVVGMVLLWPPGTESPAHRAAAGFFSPSTTYPQATVLRVQRSNCADPGTAQGQTCATALVRVDDGADAGRQVAVQLPPDAVASGVDVGTTLVLTRDPGKGGVGASYQFEDFARGTPIIALAIAFVLVVGAVARLRGLAALLGLGIAFAVLVRFMLPALLAGESPTWVTLVGSTAIMFVVLYLAHGFSVRTTTALVGTLFGLVLVAVLGAVAVTTARLTGFSSEATVTLHQFDPTLNFSGLVLAGVVVAGLGVLNDVTVTQASAVWQLSEASPQLGWRPLFARGMAIGRDHIASTVYTIVFAYAGAALPLLMLFEIYQRPVWTVLTGAEVGEEVIRVLVGAIALVLAVPVTTVVGAVLATVSRSRGHRSAVAFAGDPWDDARWDDARWDDGLETDPAIPAVPRRRPSHAAESRDAAPRRSRRRAAEPEEEPGGFWD
ncbi:MAG: Conserved rane protein of unknown function [Frankiales bacterium]|nr:Conserved rane protein of unknown function [Frankiales bacterium]